MLKHIFGIVNIQDSISVSTLPTKEQIQKEKVENIQNNKIRDIVFKLYKNQK